VRKWKTPEGAREGLAECKGAVRAIRWEKARHCRYGAPEQATAP
jgi:hypothetical protein